MKSVFLFLLTSIVCSMLVGQTGNKIGARQSALGGSSIMLIDGYSLWNNQAGIGYSDKITFLCSFDNSFLIKELSTKSFGTIYPTRYGVLGFSFSDFGYQLYSEKSTSLSYGRAFSNKLAFGFSLELINTKTGYDYGRSSSVTIEAGMLYQLSGNLKLGCHVYNPGYINTGAIKLTRSLI